MLSTQIRWLGTITKNRPAALQRCLSGYVSNARRFGHEPEIMICDQSSVGSDADATVEVASRVARQWSRPVFYFGWQQRAIMMRELARESSLPDEIVAFAIGGGVEALPGYGANRNAMLLLTPGDKLLSVDDDTACRTAVAHGGLQESTAWLLGGHAPSWRFSFHATLADVERAKHPMMVDVLGEHAKWLGASLPEMGGPSVDRHHGCDHILESMRAGCGRVVVTTNGVAGASGLSSHAWLLFHQCQQTREALLRSERDFAVAMQSGLVIRQCERRTVTHTGSFMSTVFGADNSRPLPPFMPLGRGEDHVFGMVLATVLRHSYVADLPFTVDHRPQHLRSPAKDFASIRLTTAMSILVGVLSEECGDGCDDRLARLGLALQALSWAPRDEFRERMRAAIVGYCKHHIDLIQDAAGTDPRYPDYAFEVAERQLLLFERIMSAPDLVLPTDLERAVGAAGASALLKSILCRYGALLAGWSALVDASRKLGGAQRFAIPVA